MSHIEDIIIEFQQYLLSAVLAINKKSEYMCIIAQKLGEGLYEATREVEVNLDKQVALLRKGLLPFVFAG